MSEEEAEVVQFIDSTHTNYCMGVIENLNDLFYCYENHNNWMDEFKKAVIDFRKDPQKRIDAERSAVSELKVKIEKLEVAKILAINEKKYSKVDEIQKQMALTRREHNALWPCAPSHRKNIRLYRALRFVESRLPSFTDMLSDIRERMVLLGVNIIKHKANGTFFGFLDSILSNEVRFKDFMGLYFEWDPRDCVKGSHKNWDINSYFREIAQKSGAKQKMEVKYELLKNDPTTKQIQEMAPFLKLKPFIELEPVRVVPCEDWAGPLKIAFTDDDVWDERFAVGNSREIAYDNIAHIDILNDELAVKFIEKFPSISIIDDRVRIK
jgi:hypothetical protein